jgi:DNA-binding LacI/PurR family transcriptional regulator
MSGKHPLTGPIRNPDAVIRPELLASRVADVLREKIAARTWGEFLPGERRLSERLGVSRGTVRAALKILNRTGVIAIAIGQQTRITHPPKRSTRSSSRIVGLVTTGPMLNFSTIAIYLIGELRRHLQQAGFEMRVFAGKQEGARDLRRTVKNLVNEKQVCCWLLLAVPASLQQWFDRQRLCAVVVGSCFKGVNLPSIDYDYAALARHGVGLLVARGHRRLALLRPAEDTAGYVAGETGFLQGVSDHAHRFQATGAVYRLDVEPDAIHRQVERLLRRAEPPTGLIVARSAHAVGAASHLQSRGRRIPHDVSILCLTDDVHLRNFSPPIAAYGLVPKIFTERLRRVVLQAATTGHSIGRPTFVIPELIPGKSIAAAPP